MAINIALEIVYPGPSVNESHYYYTYIHKWLMIKNYSISTIQDIFYHNTHFTSKAA